MKMHLKIMTLLITILMLFGNTVLSADITNEEEETYDITLTNKYNYGDQKITFEWTGISAETKLADVAKVGDYVDYPITKAQIQANFNSMNSHARGKTSLKDETTKWRVISNDGTTVKLISVGTLCNTTVRGEDFGWYKYNPYRSYFGGKWGDSGGYGYFYQLDQIAKCFANYDYVTNVRSLDILDLPSGTHASGPQEVRNFLGYKDPSDVQIKIENGQYKIVDPTGLVISNDIILLPRYTCGGNFYRAAYWAQGENIYTVKVYKGGGRQTGGIKAIATLKKGLYKISGDGSEASPWVISTSPAAPQYTIYQKSEKEQNYTEKTTTTKTSATLTNANGVLDIGKPDKPSAELGLIKGDGWNLRLTVNSGDTGTDYYHKIIAKVGRETKQYISNEVQTTITTGIAGYAYCIDDKEDTDPGKEIKFKVGQAIKVYRMEINAGKYIHIKAIDYAGNESEILHMPLVFVFRDLNLYKTYQEASNFDKTGIAQTPGWNYIELEWNPIEITKDAPEELPEVILTVDVSGSMSGSRISTVRSGAKALVNSLLTYYPDMRIGIVAFSNGPSIRANPTNDKTTLINAINGLGASGGTDAAGGINTSVDILKKSPQKNHVLILMTDGYPNSSSSTKTALSRAKQNGIKVVSLIIQTSASSIFKPYSDSLYNVTGSNATLYDTIAYSLYQEIVDSMIAKYYTYREQEGTTDFELITNEAITEINYKDKTASDRAKPIRPIITLSESADRDETVKMDIYAEDRGTAYEFYVKFVHPRTKDELYSNTVVQEIKTGIQGYAWTITTSATTDPGSTIKPLEFSFKKEEVGKWLHIRAIDYAGNLGEVCHIKIETSRFISWEELNETKELFCIQHGQTIPAREDEKHLNSVVIAGSGEYAIKEIVTDPKTGDRIGTRFVEGTTTNIYGTNPLYSYSLGKYVISPNTPLTRPGKEGNATEQEAYILNFYKENNSLESAVQKALYSTEISKGNVNWNWETTPESEALLAEANAYAAYSRKGYKYSNIDLDTTIYMDEEYKDLLLGPFILNYEPQAFKYKEKELYFARIIGMKLYNQNDEIISELNSNGENIGDIQVEFIYTDKSTSQKRQEELFTREKYKFPVGNEEFYIKIKYNSKLENVSKINKVEFIHNKYSIDAQYNVLNGTYNRVQWNPNKVGRNDEDVIWCREVENGANICIHDKTVKNHIVGCYFYLTAKVYESYKNNPSQSLIDVLWVKSGYTTSVQTIVPGIGVDEGTSNEYTNSEWRLLMDITGNVWNDGMEDQNDGIKENQESGIEKVKVKIYQIDKTGKRTGIEYQTYTDNVGNYEFKDILKGIYDLEFTYNGQIYTSTKLLANGNSVDYKKDFLHTKYSNNSVANEVEKTRKEFNKSFEEIAGNDTAIGSKGEINLKYNEDRNKSEIETTIDGYTKSEFEIPSITSSNNIYFPVSNRIELNGEKYIKIVDSKNINMGLAQRYLTNSSLKSDLYEAIFSIKGAKQRYIFSEKNIRDINSNIQKSEYIQKVNWADYNFKLEDLLNKAPDEETKMRLIEILGNQSELEIYLDYMIIIRNSGEKDKVQIAELANYYTTDMNFDREQTYSDFEMNSWVQVKYDNVKEGENQHKTDKEEVKWVTQSKYSNIKNDYEDEYYKIYTTSLDQEKYRIQKGEFLELHIIYKVKKDNNNRIELDENNAGKASMTEINGYKTYYIQDGSVAGLIDVNSKPGNANPKEETEFQEDDENKSPILKLKLEETITQEETLEEETEINRDENGNIVGYGNVIEGNVWEDLKTENTKTLINKQIISDGIRQDNEPLIQNIKVELIEYFAHPTDSSKDVHLKIRTQDTREILSLSNATKLQGGYSFINLPSGIYNTKFIYGDTNQLLAETSPEYKGNIHTGLDYQGVSTESINLNEELKKTYEDIELILVADISGSMNGKYNEQIKEKGEILINGICNRLPGIKTGLVSFNNNAKVVLKPQSDKDKMLNAIQKLGSENETAIGYGIELATNTYSSEAKQKIMIVLTDSEETVQNVEQVIKTVETTVDKNNVELITILTKENEEIFGKIEQTEGNTLKTEARRGELYIIYNLNEETILNNIYSKIAELSQLENKTSNAKDIEGDINTPGTRAYNINKYQIMDLSKAEATNINKLLSLKGEEKQKAIEEYAKENHMTAISKNIEFKPNTMSRNNIHEINLALMERPKTKLIMETEIKSIKVLLADNTELINTAKGVSKNVNGLDKDNIPITIFMDEEIMHGANLIVEYEVTIINDGEIDRLSNYITGGTTETATTSAKLIFNYASKNMLYRDTETQWDTIQINDIQGKVVKETIDKINEKGLKVYETEAFGVKLYPKDSIEVQNGTGASEAVFRVTLSKLITSENDKADLTFESSMEIVERENTAGRPSYTEIPGNYVPESDIIELDAIKERTIIITKPWGENQSRAYILIALATTTILAIIVGMEKKRIGNSGTLGDGEKNTGKKE